MSVRNVLCGGCTTISRTSDAVMVQAVNGPPAFSGIEFLPAARLDARTFAEATPSLQPWPDVGLRRPPLLTSLCRLVI